MILPKSFFQQETRHVAQLLLGKLLVHESDEGTTIGRIIETEAYLYPYDPAAHSFRGQTKRNQAMFQGGGLVYVYFVYGMHHCCNVTTEAEGEAILIRALEPMSGLPLMKKRRRTTRMKGLCDGPAKLVQAMGISKTHNKSQITTPPLYIMDQPNLKPQQIANAFRVGISTGKDMPLRYYIRDNEFVSKK